LSGAVSEDLYISEPKLNFNSMAQLVFVLL